MPDFPMQKPVPRGDYTWDYLPSDPMDQFYSPPDVPSHMHDHGNPYRQGVKPSTAPGKTRSMGGKRKRSV
jgi:hypothetical protein